MESKVNAKLAELVDKLRGTALPVPKQVTTDKDGRTYAPPDNSADIYAAVHQTQAGVFISVWSLKASVWVRLLNRYGSFEAARRQIDTYGFLYWDMAVPPHARDLRRERMAEQQAREALRKGTK